MPSTLSSVPGEPVTCVDVGCYQIPTDGPEADGTLEWDATTLVVVHAHGGGQVGFGYSYAHRAAAAVILDTYIPLVVGADALSPQATWSAMRRAARNLGQPGVAACALSAVDVALWDLKAKILDQPLLDLLGAARDSVPAYGSGGFLTYGEDQLTAQLSGWAEQGLPAVKMKIGARPETDISRVWAARDAIGADVDLFVDANGACTVSQALELAAAFRDAGVIWFEEPVSSDAIDELAAIRRHAPPGIDVTAGEYGWSLLDFRRLLEADAIDVLQPDATRCGGVTGFMQADVLCEAFDLPLSAHTAPSLHATLCCAAGRARHTEYFHDHVRIETMLMDCARTAENGQLAPDRSRAGLGLELKESDAERYAI